MSEQDDAISDLGAAGVLDAVRWAGESAYRRVMQDFDPDTDYDQSWIGYSAYILFADRLDRVFSTGRYAVTSPDDAQAGLDVVAAGLAQRESETMPQATPGLVDREDLNGSPGWRCGAWRWLLAATPFGRSDEILWGRRSPTKQKVANQPAPDQPELPFPIPGLPPVLEEPGEVPTPVAAHVRTDLVLAHSVDRETGQLELFVGRPRLNKGGGLPWHWKYDLLAEPPTGAAGGRGTGAVPHAGPDTNDVPDARVRLRAMPAAGVDDYASGQA